MPFRRRRSRTPPTAAAEEATNYRRYHYREILADMTPTDERICAELEELVRLTNAKNAEWYGLNNDAHQLLVLSGERVRENETTGHSLGPELQRLAHVSGDNPKITSALPHFEYRERRDEQQRHIAAQQAAAQAKATA